MTSSTLVVIVVNKFMVANYLVIFISLAILVMLMVYINTGQQDRMEQLHLRTRWKVPVFCLFKVFCFNSECELSDIPNNATSPVDSPGFA